MFHPVKQLNLYKLHETNADFGEVHDVYFDDLEWCVRYLVAETGSWLFGRTVLISPVAVAGIDPANAAISVNLSKDQVKHGPDISTDLPISRQLEASLIQHFGWPQYWASSYAIGPGMIYPFGVTPIIPLDRQTSDVAAAKREIKAIEEKIVESHLRSSREVIGYHAAATDGTIGHVDDLLVDDANWFIRYLVVDTGGWLADRKVLLPAVWINSISWDDSRVLIDVTRDQIASSPPYDPSQPITREYETQLFASYGRPGYWETTPSQQRPAA